jgi:ankyrin repeat protein
VQRSLRELPETLDETYERILQEIKRPNRALAQRVLQCLVAATRPLRVEELAEVLAIDFDNAEGIPRLNPGWRWEDEEQALLFACSSLIVIVEGGDVEASDSESDSDVEAGDSRLVQFSHFSVKEFLTSSRLATTSGEVSKYHIDLEPAHTVLAQACLGVLLQIQDVEGHLAEDHPLARYAAKHWTTHAQFEVSSRLQKGVECLFDPGKPHFRVWLTIYDIDAYTDEGAIFHRFTPDDKSPAAPLYYAALCGFHNLVEHLIIRYSQDVNADGGYHMRPLVAALAGEHFQTADLLHHNGADMHIRGFRETTPLHSATYNENLKVVQKLIEYGADIHAEDQDGYTPVHDASRGRVKSGSILRLLLERGADVNARVWNGRTPLHAASEDGALEAVRLLLEHGADVEATDDDGKTALQLAAEESDDEVVELLLERGADVNAQARYGRTPLHLASRSGVLEAVRLLLEHGADVEATGDDGKTALQHAAEEGDDEVVKLLLERGADVNAQARNGRTPLHLASRSGVLEAVRLLLEHGADVEATDDDGETALQFAAEERHDEVVELLREYGAT